MKGVHQSGYGGREALSICEFPRPTAGKGGVLIRVKAVSINSADHHGLTGRPYIIRAAVGLREIPGMDFSGIIESLGEETENCKFAVGDQVFGTTDVKGGAFAEYVSVSYTQIVHKPKELDWETAASIPTAGMTALQGLRKGSEINKGDRVLINGASGGVGTFAVQLAKSMGAHVTGVCSTQNVELVRSLGANVVIDYKKDKLDAATEGGKYDKIIDIAGRHRWFPLLKQQGELVAIALPETECIPCVLCCILCQPCCCCCFSSKNAHIIMQEVATSDLKELSNMVVEGTIRVVTSRHVGIQMLPDLIAGNSTTIGLGHTVGKTVVLFHGSNASPPEDKEMERSEKKHE